MNPPRRLLGLAWTLACVAACGSSDHRELCDTGPPTACAELCDTGPPTACAELGGTWNAGMACRADRGGWDVSACLRVDPTKWETVEPAIRDPRWATARCNDGTPFDFNVQLAPEPSKVWVIHLAGGGGCNDLTNQCSARDRVLTTTSPQVDRELSAIPGSGIVSRDATINPTFATANHVRATYCSSDQWAGATTDRRPSSGDPVAGWYFAGHTNVAALLAVVEERYGLDDSDPETEVLFSGSSAGGLGAHVNAALVEAALPAITARRRVRLLIDAGWHFDWIDPDPAPPDFLLGEATVRDAAVWQHTRAFWGATFDSACEAAVVEPSTCVYGPVWYPHVAARLPVLIQQSSIDAAFTGVHGIDATQPAALAAWQRQAEDSLVGVGWLFSGDTSYHVLADPGFGGLELGPAGSTLREVIGRFWADGAPERVEF
jgi:O-palmitoleoyl-L-serine hydrolase